MATVVNDFGYDHLMHSFYSLNELDKFLQSHGAFGLIKLNGLLTAVSSSPKLVLPNQWMLLSNIQKINFDRPEQSTNIMDKLVSLYNGINMGLSNQTYKPIIYVPSGPAKNLLAAGASVRSIIKNLKLWAEGYWLGVNAFWADRLNIENNNDGHTPFFDMIHYLTLTKPELLTKCKQLGISSEQFFKLAICNLPNLAIEIYDFWSKNREQQEGQAAEELFTTTDEHIPVRHDNPCPCGSGRAYQKCCLN